MLEELARLQEAAYEVRRTYPLPTKPVVVSEAELATLKASLRPQEVPSWLSGPTLHGIQLVVGDPQGKTLEERIQEAM